MFEIFRLADTFRFLSKDASSASAIIIATVTDASSAVFTKSTQVARNLKTESFPIIVPLTPLPKFPLNIEGLFRYISFYD